MLSQIPPKESSSGGSSKRESISESLESRKQFFAYILTLLRGQFCEMEGMLPAVDVTNMEHLAWTFDALFYLLQVCSHVLVYTHGRQKKLIFRAFC